MIRQRPNVNSNNVRTIRSMTSFGLIPTIVVMSLLMLLSSINAFMVTSPTVTTITKKLHQPIQQRSITHSQVSSSFAASNTNMMTKLNANDDAGNVIDVPVVVQQDKNQKKSTQPTPILVQQALQFDSISKKLGISMMTAIMIFLTSLSITTSLPSPADAAMSGGRMGGSFSSRSSSSGGGGMRMAPSRGGSYYGGSSSRSYYGPRSSTIIAPIISPFATTPFITPFYNPIVPYYGGGVGAISYNRGPGLFDLLFLGGIGWFVVSAISNTINTRSMSQWDDYDNTGSNNNLFSGITSVVEPTTVVKCSVALDVSNRDDPNSILSVLDRMAKVTAKTDTRKGVQTLTKQVALELLRRKSSIYSVSGTVQQYKNSNDAQRIYNQWSVQERSKFEQENINKFGKFDLSILKNNKDTNTDTTAVISKATMAVVTIILSVQGNNIITNKMKKIQSRSDLESILQSIASLDSNNDDLYGAEILWTPEDRSETLTKKDIIADYPELTTL